MKYKIGVIGLGYVGLPLLVAFAKKYQVIGFDINKQRIAELDSGFDRTGEISEEQLKGLKKAQLTSEPNSLKGCNFFIVTVPTPVDKGNKPDLTFLIAATKIVAENLTKGGYVVFESTVYPGCTEEICIPIIENSSNTPLKLNKDFYCGYSPERINPGDKINNFNNVIKVVSGSCDEAKEVIASIYREIVEAGVYVASSIKVAEAAKILENTQRDLNIALMNEMALIFRRLNINTKEVLEAASTKWNFLPFKPGLVGGHCIGVDPYYLTYKAESIGYYPEVILSGRRINDNMGKYVAHEVIKLISKEGISISGSKIGIMGITFKENCPDIRNSKVIDLYWELEAWGVNLLVTDPKANLLEVSTEHKIDLTDIKNFNELDALIIAVQHNEYKIFTESELIKMFKVGANKRPIIADLKSMYDFSSKDMQDASIFRL